MAAFILGFWARLCVLMDASFFFRGINQLIDWIQRLFLGSVFFRFMALEADEDVLQNNLAYRSISGFFGLFNTFGDKFFRVAVEKSVVGVVCRQFLQVLQAGLDGSFFYRFFKRSILECAGNETVFNMPYLLLLAIILTLPFIPTMLLAAVCVAAFVFFSLKLMVDPAFRARVDLVGVLIVLYIAIGAVAAAMSFARASSIQIAMLTALFMLVYFLFVTLVDTRQKMNGVIFVLCTSALGAGLYGMFQNWSGLVDMTWIDAELFEGTRLRVFSTFGNPNVYGKYLLLTIPVAFAGCFLARRWFMKAYYFGVGAILLLNLGMTYSRGCFLGMGLAVFVFILFMEKRLITFLSAGVFALPFILPPTVIERTLSIVNFADTSTAYRISIYQASLRLVQHFWLSGIGQGEAAFNSAFPLFAFNDSYALHAHNLFLQVTIEKGVFGLIVFLGILLCFHKTLVPSIRKAATLQKDKVFMAALIAAALGFLLQGVFDHVFFNYKIHLLFFILLAMGSAYARLCKGGEADD